MNGQSWHLWKAFDLINFNISEMIAIDESTKAIFCPINPLDISVSQLHMPSALYFNGKIKLFHVPYCRYVNKWNI